MHRSGTSLVAKVLEKAGIFMGVVKDHNYEAMHFLSLNQQTLWAACGNWIEPVVPEKLYWKTMPADTLFHEHFRIHGKLTQSWYRLLAPDWGWKDPRNTFTLDMWLSIYPKAKVINVTRDSEAVAQSLQNRNQVIGEVQDSRLDDLKFNLALWEKYTKQASTYHSRLGNRYLEIRYEDIVQLKEGTIGNLSRFTGKNLMPVFQKYVKK